MDSRYVDAASNMLETVPNATALQSIVEHRESGLPLSIRGHMESIVKVYDNMDRTVVSLRLLCFAVNILYRNHVIF